MKSILSIGALLFASCLLNAQGSTPKVNYELGISTGLTSSTNSNLDDVWSKLDSDFISPSQDDSFYYYNNYHYLLSSSVWNVNFSIKPNVGEQKLKPVFRFSYQYSNGLYAQESWFKNSEYPYDTLTSSNNGQQYYIDSILYKGLNRYYTSNLHQISVGVLIERGVKKRFTFYTGFEVGIGITSGNKITTSDYESYSFRGYPEHKSYQAYNNNYYSNYSSNRSEKRQATLGSISSNIPLGVKFTLGKKDNFLSRTMLYYEISGGTNVYFNSQIGAINQFYLKNLFGLKYTF